MMPFRNFFPSSLCSGGFRFPREHGLSSIWVGAVGLGIGLSFYSQFDLFALLLALIFASSVLFCSDSLMMQIKRKSDGFEWMPPLTVIISSLGIILWNQTLELLLILGAMGGLFLGYLLVSLQSKKKSPIELILGSVSMSLLASSTYLVIVGNVTSQAFIELLVINWVFIGVSIAHIQYVETLKDKITIKNFFYSWIVIVGSLIIPSSMQIVNLVIFVPLVEPTIFVLMQVYRKEKIKESKRNIKIIGLQLMFRLWIAVGFLIMIYPLIIPS